METKHLEQKVKQIARTRVTKDVIVLYMLSKKYKIDLLSLLALYEVYDKDVFLFFYILSGEKNTTFIGKSAEEIDFNEKVSMDFKESNLKLMFTKAKKIANALRRESEQGLTSITLPWYSSLKKYCMKTNSSGECYINFYTILKEEEEKAKEVKSRKAPKKKEVVAACV